VSWFQNLEYALERGLRCYVAGWTDPEVKRDLGAAFTHTQHAVYVRNPVLRALLKPFRRLFETGYR
jgi:predicted N-acyltransferase